jgi:hypothetical protein
LGTCWDVVDLQLDRAIGQLEYFECLIDQVIQARKFIQRHPKPITLPIQVHRVVGVQANQACMYGLPGVVTTQIGRAIAAKINCVVSDQPLSRTHVDCK